MPKQIRTKSVVVQGEMKAIVSAIALIARSVWFQITPCPDDQWEITVKLEQNIDLDGRPL